MKNSFLKLIFNYNLDEDTCEVSENKEIVYITASLIRQDIFCPLCEKSDVVKNGHTTKVIRECTYYFKEIRLTIKIQRFKCKHCGHVFYEKNDYINRSEILSNMTIVAIMHNLLNVNQTFDSTGDLFHLTGQTVSNIFDKYYVYKDPTTLPEILSFDEKSSNEKETNSPFIFVTVDFMKHKIFNILRDRTKATLFHYFSSFPKKEREKVKYVTIDMWQTYKIVALECFPNVTIAVDSFHVIKNLNVAVNKVRTIIMQKFNQKTENEMENHINYYLLKHFNYFLLMEYDDISSETVYCNKERCHYTKQKMLQTLLEIDPSIKEAYKLGQAYREFNKTARYENAREELEDLIEKFLNSNINEMKKFGFTLSNWKEEIINSFITVKDINDKGIEYDRRLSNGMIESLNRTIEQMQFAARGFGNFYRMKNRLIYSINRDYPFEDDTPIPVEKKYRTPKFKKEKKEK